MNTLKKILIGTTVAAGSTLAFAGADAGVDVASAYIFRGATVSDDVSVQPTLNGTIDEGPLAGFSVGTWAHFNTDSDEFEEVDYYAGYSIPVGEETSIDIGYTEYVYPGDINASTNASGGASTTDSDREVSLGTGAICPLTGADLSLGVYYGLDGGIDEQVYVELGAEKEFAVCEQATVNAGVTAGIIANQAKGSALDEGLSFIQLSLGASHGIFAASVNYVIETDDDVLAVDEDFFASIGVAIDL